MSQLTANTSQTTDTPDAAGLNAIRLMGVRLHVVAEAQAVAHILDELNAGRGGWVITPNLDHLRRATRDEGYRALLEEGDLMLADGMPLIWAAKMQGTPLPQRVAGSSLVGVLAQAIAARGRSLYLLGGAPGAAQAAADVLRQRCPGLNIVGMYCPPMGFERDEQQMKIIRDQLHQVKPDIVYVALGSPKQELLIQQVRRDLPASWWLGVGISLSFLGGQVRRAPRWMQKVGLEWLHRLCQEPGRLARRYLVEGIPFALHLFACSLMSRGQYSVNSDKKSVQ